jgi:hypothetical protein
MLPLLVLVAVVGRTWLLIAILTLACLQIVGLAVLLEQIQRERKRSAQP